MSKKIVNFPLFLLFLMLVINRSVYAQIQSWEKSGCITEEGVPTLKCLEVVFGNIITMASGLVVLVLFIMFVIGAFKYLTSLGNAEKVKQAQETLKFALVGFLIFISSYLILNIIQILFLGGSAGKVNLFKFEIPGP